MSKQSYKWDRINVDSSVKNDIKKRNTRELNKTNDEITQQNNGNNVSCKNPSKRGSVKNIFNRFKKNRNTTGDTTSQDTNTEMCTEIDMIQDKMYQKPKIIVLGYFGKKNIGDESFVIAYNNYFSEYELIIRNVYQDLDDIANMKDIHAVILGGGDVITKHFMNKLSDLLSNYTGKIYAFSVGIPYPSEMYYLSMFDHIVFRAKNDIPFGISSVGSKNISYLPDITWTLKPLVDCVKIPSDRFQIGVCLAQPAFHSNEHKESILSNIVTTFVKLSETRDITINLYAFNTSNSDDGDYEINSDYIVNTELYDMLFQHLSDKLQVINHVDNKLTDTLTMLKELKQNDLIIAMRFHANIFAMIQDVPLVPLYVSRKVENLLNDMGYDQYGYKLPTDDQTKPTELNSDYLLELINKRIESVYIPISVDLEQYNLLRVILNKNDPRQQLLTPNFINYNINDVFTRTKQMLKLYLNITDTTLDKWFKKTVTINQILKKNKNIDTVARIISFAITYNLSSEYVWGLTQNMQSPDFSIHDAIVWIYKDYIAIESNKNKLEIYHPSVNADRRLWIDMKYINQDNYKGYHRSGWTYVISGLENIEASNFMRTANIMVDMNLERTFLWGSDVPKLIGLIPYSKPWVGFIHHTFEQRYSEYNCVNLLRNTDFINSLKTCKCLFVLSSYLAEQLSTNLQKLNLEYIPQVMVLYHPTETPTVKFTFRQYCCNTNKKAIHIGGWLRNMYSIYDLQLYHSFNVSKAMLIGKDSNNYIRPDGIFEKVKDNFIKEVDTITDNDTLIIRNKYIEHMLDSIESKQKTVSLIEHVDNDAYDILLSENIVFLNYIDVSASNTVIECIVRNTPVIVNRHPALEEYLGIHYPGFYNDLTHATQIIQNICAIKNIYRYLTELDKSKLSLEYFMNDFQTKLTTVINNN